MKQQIKTFDELLLHASSIKNKRVAVAYANNEETFSAISSAQKYFDARFILTGDKEIIRAGLDNAGASNSSIEIHHCPDPKQSSQAAIEFLRDGKADVLLKGSVDTATLMKLVLAVENGLRTGKLLSDIFIFEYPDRKDNKLVMITDGGLNLSPDLKQKIDLIKNTVSVAHALSNSNPRVAILSASEFVNPKLQSSVDAEILTQMNLNGEISGCVIAGPLALDSAMIPESAKEKKITSSVAGNADVLIAPNIETANSLAKSTTYFAHYRLAHVIIGAKVPILITSRADKSDAKLLSMAMGILMSSIN